MLQGWSLTGEAAFLDDLGPSLAEVPLIPRAIESCIEPVRRPGVDVQRVFTVEVVAVELTQNALLRVAHVELGDVHVFVPVRQTLIQQGDSLRDVEVHPFDVFTLHNESNHRLIREAHGYAVTPFSPLSQVSNDTGKRLVRDEPQPWSLDVGVNRALAVQGPGVLLPRLAVGPVLVVDVLVRLGVLRRTSLGGHDVPLLCVAVASVECGQDFVHLGPGPLAVGVEVALGGVLVPPLLSRDAHPCCSAHAWHALSLVLRTPSGVRIERRMNTETR